MKSATTYEGWYDAAQELDALEHNDEWRSEERSIYYDHEEVREDIKGFEASLAAKDTRALAELLEESLTRHHYDLVNPRLYEQTRTGENKDLARRYLALTARTLHALADEEMTPAEAKVRLEQIKRAQHKYGRSALMLSGGATLGIYHLGVVKALFLRGILPRVISGTSMGAIIAASICTRTSEEIADLFQHPEQIHRQAFQRKAIARVLKDPSLFESAQLLEHIIANIGEDCTFAEAYRKTGAVLNISVAPTRDRQKPRILNHITAPDLLVAHSAMVSCAMPLLFAPGMLMARAPEGEAVPYLPKERWIDGSVGGDVPMARVGRLHNVNHFIVSQTNAHVYLFAGKSECADFRQIVLGFAAELTSSLSATLLNAARRGVQEQPLRPVLDRLYHLMAQPYMGDINIHPKVDPWMLRKVVSNPDVEDVKRFILDGERETWPKIALIRDQTLMSRTIEAVIAKLEAKLNGAS